MKSEITGPMAAGAVVVLLVIVVGVFVWISNPHPSAPRPGEVILAPKVPGGGPRSGPPPAGGSH